MKKEMFKVGDIVFVKKKRIYRYGNGWLPEAANNKWPCEVRGVEGFPMVYITRDSMSYSCTVLADEIYSKRDILKQILRKTEQQLEKTK